MELALWEGLFCLLPSLLVLLLSLGRRCSGLHCRVRSAARAAGLRLWVLICLILELPPDTKTMMQTEEVKPPDIVSGAGHVSDGPRLISKPTALAKYLLQSCSSLTRMKPAPGPRGDPHLQTLSGMLWEGRGGGGAVVQQRAPASQRRGCCSPGLGGGDSMGWDVLEEREPVEGGASARRKGSRRLHCDAPDLARHPTVPGWDDLPPTGTLPAGHAARLLRGGGLFKRGSWMPADHSTAHRVWGPSRPGAGRCTKTAM